MDFTEKTVKKNLIYDGKVVKLYVDDVSLPSGNVSKREYVSHNGGACALAVENGNFLLVRQYRYAYGEELLEIPAGKLEKGEDPENAAIRELEEETGYGCKKITKLGVYYPTPGYTNEKLYIYFAELGEIVGQHLDSDEFLSVVRVPISEAEKMIEDGRIKDAKTVIAISRYILQNN